ncbi:hypothetical protein [Catenuloplanes atrovinosus]|uniref:Uncharacterized protein n=1 Tax=Catenuloplanes atrovinosus TaxID=137266 RepID=A0AAE4CB55_9ACTN|nr:hypothetical protein [Catenuloplanes atrovinosus]MDR7277707.1 hypothetical protein [Catenuloplanes atrovinosus]
MDLDLSRHVPHPRSWRCWEDGELYPCLPVKLSMLREHGPHKLLSEVLPLAARAFHDLTAARLAEGEPPLSTGLVYGRVTAWASSDGIRRLLSHPPWCSGANAGLCWYEHASAWQEVQSSTVGDGRTGRARYVAPLVPIEANLPAPGTCDYGATLVRLEVIDGAPAEPVTFELPYEAWPDRHLSPFAEWAALEPLHAELRDRHLPARHPIPIA